MSDARRFPAPDGLGEVIAALRRPVAIDTKRKREVMMAIRAAAAATPSRPSTARRARASRGSRLCAATGLAIAAGLSCLVAISAARTGVAVASRPAAPSFGDTVVSTLRDTVRLVHFMLVAPAASRVALVGDFNGWDARSTPLARAGASEAWTGAVALKPGRHLYAFVVNDTQWVSDPALPALPPDELAPPRSVIVVPGDEK